MKLKLSGKYSDWEVLIDKSDFNKISKYTWWGIKYKDGRVSVYTQINRKTILLHLKKQKMLELKLCKNIIKNLHQSTRSIDNG